MAEELAYMVYTLDEYTKISESVKAKNAQGAKIATPFIGELTSLKEKLVVTKGDNYVGAAEPQLREKMAELYSKVADSYYKPNQAELTNLSAIETRFTESKAEFKKIKEKNLPKITAFQSKDGPLQPLVLKTFEEFKREP